MWIDLPDCILWCVVMIAAGFLAVSFYGRTQEANKYTSRAVANGCAIRVLDSASGEVKTVWKDGKP